MAMGSSASPRNVGAIQPYSRAHPFAFYIRTRHTLPSSFGNPSRLLLTLFFPLFRPPTLFLVVLRSFVTLTTRFPLLSVSLCLPFPRRAVHTTLHSCILFLVLSQCVHISIGTLALTCIATPLASTMHTSGLHLSLPVSRFRLFCSRQLNPVDRLCPVFSMCRGKPRMLTLTPRGFPSCFDCSRSRVPMSV